MRILLALILLSAGALANSTYTYRVEVPELPPLRSRDFTLSIPDRSHSKYETNVSVAGDWPDVDHAVAGGYGGSLTITRYNRNPDAAKVATSVTVTVKFTRKIGAPDDGEREVDICDTFPACLPPPPEFVSYLVSVARLSADGNYLLFWTPQEGGRVVPVRLPRAPTLGDLRQRRRH